ncbi:hypothetical protein [Anabaena sp. UHCC 0204]|uniref:hypothetical protein n=1 Tax=Anabaena sp. UHCC 0204 TaxID=2590009 RepID=UPI0020C544EF|nr:hypothetical protein [Anabaena sp. UHCC 0204]
MLNKLENHEKCLELYSYLVERLDLQNTKQSETNNQKILTQAKQHYYNIDSKKQ